MSFSRVTESHAYPCPACGVDQGMWCWPRSDDDAPWVHKIRSDAMEFNMRLDAAAARGEFVLL